MMRFQLMTSIIVCECVYVCACLRVCVRVCVYPAEGVQSLDDDPHTGQIWSHFTSRTHSLHNNKRLSSLNR